MCVENYKFRYTESDAEKGEDAAPKQTKIKHFELRSFLFLHGFSKFVGINVVV